MTDQDKTPMEPEDTEGHKRPPSWADAESAEGGDDTEGHGFKKADAESAEGDDDTEGHKIYGRL